jgi:P-type E1-E2 ATPase
MCLGSHWVLRGAFVRAFTRLVVARSPTRAGWLAVTCHQAIEDELQDNVAKTIDKLRHAGIKVWMCTGDKLETVRELVRVCFCCVRCDGWWCLACTLSRGHM